jgi:uncharacterized membrane protein YgcG
MDISNLKLRQISHMEPYGEFFLKMNVLNFKLLISIQIGQFRGHGKLSANGGKGHSSGGGGAGGRIGILVVPEKRILITFST